MGIKTQNKKGFTIIEVVLVLAIAGLIFLMVFLALPALQRSQRDTQRKNDMSRMVAAYHTYTSNNQGRNTLSDSLWGKESSENIKEWDEFFSNYLKKNGETFQDPTSHKDYIVQVGYWGFARGKAGDGIITINPKNKCADNKTTNHSTYQTENRGDIAAQILLESGGSYCFDLN